MSLKRIYSNISLFSFQGLFLFKISVLLFYLFAISCTSEDKVTIIDDKAIANESNTSDWLAYGRTHSEQRFSPIDDVNTDNVAKLKVDWYVDLPNDVGLVSTPLVVNGIMYFTGTMNILRAVTQLQVK